MGKDLNGKELGTGIRQRKDKRYEARATIKGQTICLYNSSIRELKKEFENAKKQIEQQLKCGIQLDITLMDWFIRWMDTSKKPILRPTSFRTTKNTFLRLFGTSIGNQEIRNISNLLIQDTFNQLMQQGVAASTLNRTLSTLRECLESAKINHIIEENPCINIQIPWETKKKPEKRIITQLEQEEFLLASEDSWYKEMFYVMFLTGMRIGEIGGLQWEDVDFKNKCIHINHSLTVQYYQGNKNMGLTKPKTINSYRTIPFIGETEKMLLSQKAKQQQIKKRTPKKVWRGIGEFENLVFCTSLGSPVSRHIAEKEINNIVAQINIKRKHDAKKNNIEYEEFERIHPHAIRYAFATRAVENKVDAKVLQSLMGHSHFSTTMDFYVLVSQDKKLQEIQKMGNAITVDPK